MDHTSIMDQLINQLQELIELGRLHLPPNAIPPPVFTGVVMLLFGVGIAVLGARLARWFIAVVFAVGGITAGLAVSRDYGVNPLLSGLVGSLVLGSFGYVLHRLWVGLFAAVFLASIAMTALTAQEVLPYLPDFARAETATAPAEFHTGTGEPPPAVDWHHLNEYLRNFGDYVVAREPNIRLHAGLAVIIAGLAGLLLGVFFVRLTLILFTAAFGSILIASGIGLLGPAIGIQVYQTAASRPDVTLLALVSFFIASLAIQTILTRPGSRTASAPAKVAD